ncbi:MAG: fibro-slime domain-containing protein [Ruminococcus sp.]|nr:fibro-slime domain-containing protein [Ruminococcus sp.]
MTKKQNRSFGFGKRTLSVVLAVLLILSTMAVMLTVTSLSAGAAISYWFVSGSMNGWTTSATSANKIDSGSGGSVTIPVTASGINFKMVAEEGGAKWCGVSGSGDEVTIPNNTKTELVWNGGQNIHLNLPANTTSVTFTLTVENGKNYVTATPNTSGGGGGGDTSQMTYTAPVNTNNSANTASNLFWANATYFDYLSDEELANTQWLKPIQAGTKNFGGAIDEWYPFYAFNREVVKAQADAHSDWAQPLYFGNFTDTNDAYKESSHHQGGSDSYGYGEATNSYNVTRFSHIANNSDKSWNSSIPHVYDMYTSYQGLVNSSLDANGNLLLPNGQQAPYFNASESGPLSGYAKVVNSSFPFKVTDVPGKDYKKYTFNSKNATDNVYFTWASDGSATYPTGVNYGAGTTYGVQDGLSRFMYNTASGYGIFPFNNASNNYKGTKTNANENLNYGFGIKTQMKFRVPAPDESAGVNTASDPVYFDFTGDDDLWMYITDESGNSQLVLDMGGDHKESHGRVNFNTLKATVDKTGTSGASAVKDFTFDYSQTYTMTVFYMERGLIESNCKMEFTMTPLGNNFIVTEEIDTTDVNEGLKEVVSAISEFGFKSYDGETAVTDDLYGDFTLGHGGRMDIPHSILGINSQPNVEQYTPPAMKKSYLSYSTSWTYWDNVSNNTRTRLDSGTTSESSTHTMINTSGNEYDYAELQVDYVNTPNLGSFSVKKEMAAGSTAPADKTFPATIFLQFKEGGSFTPYTLVDVNGNTCTDGQVNLVPGQTISFSGIPTGTHVYVVEESGTNYTASYNYSDTNPYIVGTSSGNITVTNKMLSGDGTLEITKTLDGENYTGDAFSFTAEGVTKSGYVTGSTVQATSATNGTVTFDLTFTQPGNYLYKITEDDLSADLTNLGYVKDRSTIYAKFAVVSGASGLEISGTPKYYSDEACTAKITSVEFKNTTEHASISINKSDDTGNPLGGNVFAVVKVKDSTPLSKDQINNLIKNDSAKYVKGTTLNDGSLYFGDLPIYQNGDQVYDNGTSQWVSGTDYMDGNHTPQTYMVFEYSPKNGYNTNNTVKFVTFPYEDQYNVTFDYVNLAVLNPASGFGGTARFFIVGLGILGTAALLAMAYVFFKKRRVKATYAPRHGR